MLEIVLCLSGAVLALLAVPVALRMRIERALSGGAISMRAEAALLAGLAGVAVTGPGAWRWGPTLGRRSLGGISFPIRARGKPGRREKPLRGQPTGRTETASGDGPERTAPRRTPSRRLLRFPLEPGLRLLGSLTRAINLRRVRVDGRLGLGDPAKTGYLYGVLQAVEASLPKRRQLQIRLEPDFREQVFCGRLDICLHLSLARVAASLLRFGLEVGIRQLSGRLESARWIPFLPGWKAS